LHAVESNADGPTTVSFNAYHPSSVQLRESTNSDDDPNDFVDVEVALDRCIAARMLPGHSDQDVLDPSSFDFSQVPFDLNLGNYVQNIIEFHKEWKQTGICPNPNMYEVIGSSWLSGLIDDNRDGFRCYLFEGHDSYVEAIATGFQWRVLR
jgi:hypothetical protein